MKKSTVPVSEGTAVFWLIAKNDSISTDICRDGVKMLATRLKTNQDVIFLKEEMDILLHEKSLFKSCRDKSFLSSRSIFAGINKDVKQKTEGDENGWD